MYRVLAAIAFLTPLAFSRFGAAKIELISDAVGATGQDLRLWKAREAVRQAEMLMASQTANLQAAETRATSLLGWVAAGLLVGLAALAAHPPVHAARYVVAFGAPAIAIMILCVAALWPHKWNDQGANPVDIRDSDEASELSIMEALAWGQSDAIAENYKRLERCGRFLRFAWLCFALTPVVYAATLLIPW